MSFQLPELCGTDGCRLITGHRSGHDRYPTSAWGFMSDKDKKKLDKAGFATPRGGAKGAYQNHVVRSNKVIIPFEKLSVVTLENYQDGYVIRLYPEQYFEADHKVRTRFIQGENAWIIPGENAFVLYRTHDSYKNLPPLENWQIRSLATEIGIATKRGKGAEDVGHYVLRLTTLADQKKINEGPPQGLFAPEYADYNTNYLCRCILAWLIVHTVDSPYTTTQATHIQAILAKEGLLDAAKHEFRGVLRHGLCACPLCMRFIRYQELHDMVTFGDDPDGIANAAGQVEGATRSTIVNLFHLVPLTYQGIEHIPENMAWGHAICNTRLGQRRCYSLEEIKENGNKVGIIKPEGIETFGWMSADWQMIRSPGGAVWIQLNGDIAEGPPEPTAAEVFESEAEVPDD